jgi:hypothetical protein
MTLRVSLAAGHQKRRETMKSEIIYSSASVQIVTQPYLVGPELEVLALASSQDFARALPADLPADAVSLEILNGGHYYFVAPAVEAALGRPCAVSTVRAKRRQEPTGEWRVDVWDKGGADITTCSCVLIGDTIATGTTLMGTIRQLLAERTDLGLPFPDFHIFCIAGSSAVCFQPGIGEINGLLAAQGKSMTLYFANAKYNMADNGTDLGFVGAEYNAQAEAEINAKLGSFAGNMRCCVWDWGDRFREVRSHLTEIRHFYGADAACPAWLLEGIDARLKALPADSPRMAVPPVAPSDSDA